MGTSQFIPPPTWECLIYQRQSKLINFLSKKKTHPHLCLVGIPPLYAVQTLQVLNHSRPGVVARLAREFQTVLQPLKRLQNASENAVCLCLLLCIDLFVFFKRPYSSLCPFLCFTTNQVAQKYFFLPI